MERDKKPSVPVSGIDLASGGLLGTHTYFLCKGIEYSRDANIKEVSSQLFWTLQQRNIIGFIEAIASNPNATPALISFTISAVCGLAMIPPVIYSVNQRKSKST